MNDVRKVVGELIEDARGLANESGSIAADKIRERIARAEQFLASMPADGELIPKPSHSPAVVAWEIEGSGQHPEFGWKSCITRNAEHRDGIERGFVSAGMAFTTRALYSQPAAQVPSEVMEAVETLVKFRHPNDTVDVTKILAFLKSIAGPSSAPPDPRTDIEAMCNHSAAGLHSRGAK